MRVALRLIALAVGLAAAGAAAAGTKQPSLASIGATATGEENDYLAVGEPVREPRRSGQRQGSLQQQCFPRVERARLARRRQDDRRLPVAAGRGDAAAAYALGIMYRKGLGVPQDPAEAAKWLRKSADLGLARAQTSLGAMYAFGEGVPQSRAEAMKWTKAAAEQGDARAQYVLGLMYCDGHGDPQDLVQAHMWLNLAAAQGLRQAGAARDQVAAWIGSPAETAKAQADGGRAQRGGGAAGGRGPAEAVTETRALGYSVESPRALPVGRDDHGNPLARDAAELERERTGRQIELDALARPFAVLRAAERDRMQVGPAVKHVDPGAGGHGEPVDARLRRRGEGEMAREA